MLTRPRVPTNLQQEIQKNQQLAGAKSFSKHDFEGSTIYERGVTRDSLEEVFIKIVLAKPHVVWQRARYWISGNACSIRNFQRLPSTRLSEDICISTQLYCELLPKKWQTNKKGVPYQHSPMQPYHIGRAWICCTGARTRTAPPPLKMVETSGRAKDRGPPLGNQAPFM